MVTGVGEWSNLLDLDATPGRPPSSGALRDASSPPLVGSLRSPALSAFVSSFPRLTAAVLGAQVAVTRSTAHPAPEIPGRCRQSKGTDNDNCNHHHHEPQAIPEGFSFRMVDPRALVDNPDNARRPERDRIGLAPSIRALGVLTALTVRQTADGTLEIIAGERRKYSSIEAGLTAVPCLVRDDLSPFQQLAGMLVENRDRQGLTPIEEAVAIQQLAGMDGVTAKEITATTGIKTKEIRQSVTVASSEVAATCASRYDLTLAQSVVLAEFDDDSEVVKQLVVCATKEPHRWDHLVARVRAERKERIATAALTAPLVEAGVTVIELDYGWLPGEATWLRHLPAPKGRKNVTEASHRGCPGHAAAVVSDRQSDDGLTVEYLCTDPVGNGHMTGRGSAAAGGTKAGGMTDDQKAERKTLIANNKAWLVAEAVRRQFVVTLLARKTPPKGTLRYVTEAVLLDPRSIGDADDAALAATLGQEPPARFMGSATATGLLEKVTDARLPLALLAQVAASVEATTTKQAWRSPTQKLGRYLAFLASAGYTLSDVEQIVTDAMPGGDA